MAIPKIQSDQELLFDVEPKHSHLLLGVAESPSKSSIDPLPAIR
jgi:hypothetical protein